MRSSRTATRRRFSICSRRGGVNLLSVFGRLTTIMMTIMWCDGFDSCPIRWRSLYALIQIRSPDENKILTTITSHDSLNFPIPLGISQPRGCCAWSIYIYIYTHTLYYMFMYVDMYILLVLYVLPLLGRRAWPRRRLRQARRAGCASFQVVVISLANSNSRAGEFWDGIITIVYQTSNKRRTHKTAIQQ